MSQKNTRAKSVLKGQGRREDGLTLVELMISMALGLLVVMAATALLLSTKAAYSSQDDRVQVQDTGRYAVESITRAVRQAAYQDWGRGEAPITITEQMSANINGLDATSLQGSDGDNPLISSGTAVNGSDVLALRFFGSGVDEKADNTVINCAGFGIPPASSPESADTDRGWSIFYVNKNKAGESELYCKYWGKKGNFSAQSIAQGVESFQVLYGLDTDGDGLPNQFLTATAIKALDDALSLEGNNAGEKEADKNKKTNWKKIVIVKVALLVHGSNKTSADGSLKQYDLFGKEYSDKYASTDIGTQIKEQSLSKGLQNRSRKVFTTTIQLRNDVTSGAV